MKEYRCTRNALYSHPCLGRDDLTARQGYYIKANDPEEAWQKMAVRFPEESYEGFTVEEWQEFSVKVIEIKRDKEGNVTELERDGEGNVIKEVKKDKEGNVVEVIKRDKEGNIIADD